MTARKVKQLDPKKKSAKFRLKFELDTSNWGAGEWSDQLSKAMKVEIDHDTASVNFEINGDLWEQAALKIAKEAVEAFFNDGMYVSLTKDGVSLRTEDGLETVIGFSEVTCDLGQQDRDALVRALNAQTYDNDNSYEPYRMDELARMAADAERKAP